MQTTLCPTPSRTVLPKLFIQYVAGRIAESSWDQFMHVLDATDATSQERLALATFFNDAYAEDGEAVKLPGLDEVEDLLSDMRAPAC